MRKLTWLLIFFCFTANALTIDQAYQAIAVNRIPFNVKNNQLNTNISDYLNQLFKLTDELVVIRVNLQNEYFNNNFNDKTFKTYQHDTLNILKKISLLTPPHQLISTQKNIIKAVQNQVAYFSELQLTAQDSSTPLIDMSHKLVQHSHQLLVATYYHLLKILPHASKAIQSSFYSHFCALDLI